MSIRIGVLAQASRNCYLWGEDQIFSTDMVLPEGETCIVLDTTNVRLFRILCRFGVFRAVPGTLREVIL